MNHSQNACSQFDKMYKNEINFYSVFFFFFLSIPISSQVNHFICWMNTLWSQKKNILMWQGMKNVVNSSTFLVIFGAYVSWHIWAESSQNVPILTLLNRKSEKVPLKYVPSEDSDQPARSRSLIRIFTGRSLDCERCSFFIRTKKTLIRLRRCSSWFESSLDARVIRYAFSHCGSFIIEESYLSLPHSGQKSADLKLISFLIFPRKHCLTFNVDCPLRRQFAWNDKACFL